MKKTAVITGGSSGIGKSAAALFCDAGYDVFELSRNDCKDGTARHINCDIKRVEDIKRALLEVFSETGRLDLLINNAGMGISGAVEFTELSDAHRIFDVNFFGAFCVIKESLPYLRKTPNSRIINVSSVAAPISIPYQAFYSATKAAINSLTLSLSNEVRTFGISVSAVMPGDTRTGFTAARVKNTAGRELYGDAIDRAVASMEKDEQCGMSCEYVAKLIYKVAHKKNPAPLYTAGAKYKIFTLIAKLLPARALNWIVGKLYS
ncbi:MAG: SDR family NAD(P)-dependent oxidoreductase [Oscillospiraceae bacterium]